MPLSSLNKSSIGDVMKRYCSAILDEFRLRCNELQEPITTIYIGGGTPTAIPMPLLTTFLQELYQRVIRFNHALKPNQEVRIDEFTIEANPEDISLENIEQLTAIAGINRISIGIQSFDFSQLSAIQRQHSAATSIQALEILNKTQINYSADLIYGLPGESTESWKEQLTALLSFNPPHFSSYLLSYEPGTRLYAQKERGTVAEADEQTATEMYHILTDLATQQGYNHYEISNFARQGFEAKHNSSYWNLSPYLGLGCSAHSFDGILRRINPPHLKRFLAAIETEHIAADIDEETTLNQINDYIITSLRTSYGLALPVIQERWGSTYAITLAQSIRPLLRDGLLQKCNNKQTYRIPERFWLTSDSIMRELVLLD
jgi:oxygen-independent coproporphyrinogen-3 oxidase